MGFDTLVGPSLVGGAVAAVGILAFQALWPRRTAAPPTSRGWALQGLWALLAAATWFLGSAAPVWGLLSPLAGGVLELLFLAGGLAQTGIMRSRPALTAGGLGLAVAAVVLGTFPPLLFGRALVVALAFGIPAYLTTRTDK